MAKRSKKARKATPKPREGFAKPGVFKATRRSGKLLPPKRIFAVASPMSVGGISMFDAAAEIAQETAADFRSEARISRAAATRLREAGFDILQITESTINIAGSPATFDRAFGAPIVVRQEPTLKEFGKEDLAEFLDCPNDELPGLISTTGTDFADLLEGVALEEPRYYMGPNAFAPKADYWHLSVPGDVSLGCNADRAHRAGITGRGVVVSMVDSGWYRHPFFTRRGYRSDDAILGPGASNPAADESGHGTAESANIFAVAPDVRLKPIKMNFANSIGAFNAAVNTKPDIITCSWGSSTPFGPLSAANIALGNAISAAVAAGIVVVFSAGNGHWGFPGQHPDVISAGGVFMEPDGAMRASDYASGFASNIYLGRHVPDVSGLVGMRPRARYIMLPLEPGDSIDVGGAGGSHPDRDETGPKDGWAAISGTSAAAPQLAGVAALVKQSSPALGPSDIRSIMKSTARDVTAGACHPNQGNKATTGPDLATGHGLVDAHRATILARLSIWAPPQWRGRRYLAEAPGPGGAPPPGGGALLIDGDAEAVEAMIAEDQIDAADV